MKMLNKQSKEPYYVQLSHAIENMILTGYFQHGQKLPTLTEMKDMFQVSLKVAAQAYDDLNKKGYIYSQRGKGYFVSHYNQFRVDLKKLYELESELVHERLMERNIILFEKVSVEGYVAEQLKLNQGDQCFHIKQAFGHKHKNVLLQDIYLPSKHFPKLFKQYEDYPTLLSLIMNGYRYKIDRFKNRYYPSQATIEHEIFLQLQVNDPLWRIESVSFINDNQPIALLNQYMSGEFITMAVMLDVN